MTGHDDTERVRQVEIEQQVREKKQKATEFTEKAQQLGHLRLHQEDEASGHTQAIKAKWVTPLDPVIETADKKRLPAVPIAEAIKLNNLRHEVQGQEIEQPPESNLRRSKDGTTHGIKHETGQQNEAPEAPLREAIPPSRTNPLFPPLPMYGPPTPARTLQCWYFRACSSVLSLCFLMVIVLGAIFDGIPRVFKNAVVHATGGNPDEKRPFYAEEVKRSKERKAAERAWAQQQKKGAHTPSGEKGHPQEGEFVPTEGGPDLLVVDIAYYARRVGLDAEVFEVQTEDGFIIELWHIFNPREYQRRPIKARGIHGPDIFTTLSSDSGLGEADVFPEGRKKYPVLMIHGLLQSAGAFCCNDDDSLAFYLAKSGYDVWLGNNRCGFDPKHTSLTYDDPRCWAWNIRQMGVMDLPALISRVLSETGFPKLALIAHSQGTTQTFVALAKEQRPDIGERISVFCALAPAAYAGPLIQKIYLKFMSIVSPSLFRMIFGIHAFIPLMMVAHDYLPARPYSWMGYHVFSFLFSWSDKRWDRSLRDRMFQWAPSYVSAESMRWWLGRECFAKQKCILATREEGQLEDQEDEEDDEVIRRYYVEKSPQENPRRKLQRNISSFQCEQLTHQHHDKTRGKYAWYDSQFPPLAMWVAGADDLVDGRRLLRRFDRGREPHVRVVHKKLIEGYEHLDVIWAMDSIEKVGKEVREVIWRTASEHAQKICRTPIGCGRPVEEDLDVNEKDVPMLNSDGRRRMQRITEADNSDNGGKPRVVKEPNGAEIMVDESRNFESSQRHYEETFEDVDSMGGDMKEEVSQSKKVRDGGRRYSEAKFEDLEEKRDPFG